MFSSRTSRFKEAISTMATVAIVVIVIIIIAAGAYAGLVLFKSTSTTTSSTTSTTSSSSTTASSSSTSSSGNTKPIVVGMTVSQSGQYASLDAGYLYLNNAWMQYVNTHGGLVDASGVHHNVTVITEDDSSDVPTAVNDYKQFAETQGANILVSPYSADTGLELLPVSQSDKVPIIMSEASTRSMWNGTYTYAVTPLVPYWSNDTTNAWSASYFGLLNKTGWAHTIAFVGWDITWAIDDYTSGIYLAQHTNGLTITSQQLLQPNFNNPDFSSAISTVLSTNGGKAPDIVFCAMFGPFCAQFITQAESQGLVPKQWHTIEWGSAFQGILAGKSVSMDNITTDVFWTPSFPSSNPGTSMFNTITQTASTWAVGNKSAAVTWYDYQNIEIRWEIFQMINASISQVPNSDFANQSSLNGAINNALHSLNIQTISGPLKIQSLGFGTMALVTVQFANESSQFTGGDINTVYPSSVANATYVHP